MTSINPDYFKSAAPDPARRLVDMTNERLESMGLSDKKIDIDKLMEETEKPSKKSSTPPSQPSLPKSGWVI